MSWCRVAFSLQRTELRSQFSFITDFRVGVTLGSEGKVRIVGAAALFPSRSVGMKGSDRTNLPLARVPLFSGLDDATIDDIFSCMRSRRYAAGELICRQGDPSDSLFLLRSGVAQAFLTSLTGSSATT